MGAYSAAVDPCVDGVYRGAGLSVEDQLCELSAPHVIRPRHAWTRGAASAACPAQRVVAHMTYVSVYMYVYICI